MRAVSSCGAFISTRARRAAATSSRRQAKVNSTVGIVDSAAGKVDSTVTMVGSSPEAREDGSGDARSCGCAGAHGKMMAEAAKATLAASSIVGRPEESRKRE